MENLPPHITLAILSRLPIKSALRCKHVCKAWRPLLERIIKSHIEVTLLFSIGLGMERCGDVRLYYGEYGQYGKILNSTDDDKFSLKKLTRLNHPPINKRPDTHAMVGSLNGLVCFSVPHHNIDDPVYICNPITGEYTYLPYFTIGKEGGMASGFGYLHSTNEYKVVRIYYPPNQRHTMGQVQVYTIGDGSGWRDIGEITHSLCSLPGIVANGALHWLDYCKEYIEIVAFDLANEEFQLLPSPPCFDNFDRCNAYCQLQVLGEHLCLIHHEPSNCMDIWSLKKNSTSSGYDVSGEQEHQCWSWNREFVIPWEGMFEDTYEPFALTKTDNVLLWYNRTILCSYDPKTATLEKLVDADKSFKNFQAIPHIKSLVSLKAIGERSKRRKIKASTDERSIRARK